MEVTHLDIFDFISMPALAIKYLCENFPKNKVFVAENPSVDAFHRSAFQGGRCTPVKPYFVSKDNAEIMKHWNIYSEIKEKLSEDTHKLIEKNGRRNLMMSKKFFLNCLILVRIILTMETELVYIPLCRYYILFLLVFRISKQM